MASSTTRRAARRRLYLAGLGTVEDLRQLISSIHQEAMTMVRIADEVIPTYLAGGGATSGPDQVHLRALLIDFLASFAELVRRWAERSAETTDDWADLSLDGKAEPALERLRALLPARPSEVGEPNVGAL